MAEYIYDFKEPPDPEGYRGRLIRCKDCKHFSATTLGMPYACWRGGERVWGETGEHAWHTLCIRVDSPDWFCADGERREENTKYEVN